MTGYSPHCSPGLLTPGSREIDLYSGKTTLYLGKYNLNCDTYDSFLSNLVLLNLRFICGNN